MKHYATLGKNQKVLCVLIWKYLQDILLSEKSKVQNNLNFIFPFVKKVVGNQILFLLLL